jgi:hypothetical protein
LSPHIERGLKKTFSRKLTFFFFSGAYALAPGHIRKIHPSTTEVERSKKGQKSESDKTVAFLAFPPFLSFSLPPLPSIRRVIDANISGPPAG